MRTNLLIQTAFLGDLLLSIPLMKQMKKQWPQHQLVLVCRKGFGDFFIKLGLVDQVFEIKKGDSSSYKAIETSAKSLDIDNILSPHESLRTAFLVKRIKANQKVSFKKWWSFFFYNQTIEKPQSWPDALRQMSLMSIFDSDLFSKIKTYVDTVHPLKKDSFGVLPPPPSWALMSQRDELQNLSIEITDNLKTRFPFVQKNQAPKALLFPGSVWATKRWSEDEFIEVGLLLQKRGYEVIVMGGPGEEVLAELVQSKIPGSFNLAGKTKVIESAWIMTQANLVIANDSASSHLAAVAEVPVVSVFGPTILEFGFRPWGQQVAILEADNVSCRPCGKHGHKVCPKGTHECMKVLKANNILPLVDRVTTGK